MARSASEEMAWKPRRLHKEDVKARVAHLQKNLPPVVREVFASSEAGAAARTPAKSPAKPAKKSKFAVLHWEPRPSGKKH